MSGAASGAALTGNGYQIHDQLSDWEPLPPAAVAAGEAERFVRAFATAEQAIAFLTLLPPIVAPARHFD